ncbi:N-acetylglucosamine kinase [Paenibacillus sp. GCM10023252]|uniref:N-acetylglucosamine kinase n=1 Tax=Paenibacillus sp. GCM10023252 TaxID=3252649 RepID=UPI003622E4B4
MRYAAGLDGGGTKTAVTVIGAGGEVADVFTSGGINYNGQDEESIRVSLEQMLGRISDACGGLHQCASICVGAAGVSNPVVAERLTAIIRASGYGGPLYITGDHETALYGTLGSPVGLLLIAGTGSICYGRSESGLTHRAGGCGHLIDDEGSGYSIGRELIRAVVKANDGRAPKTAITELLYGSLGLSSVRELIGYVHDKSRSKRDIASLAPLLTAACAAGDEAAWTIVNQSASALLELVEPVAEQLSMQEGKLVLAGSVLLRNKDIRSAFEQRLGQSYPRMSCVQAPDHAASMGAAQIAWMRVSG